VRRTAGILLALGAILVLPAPAGATPVGGENGRRCNGGTGLDTAAGCEHTSNI
jgi:hypothetical protein